jgi:hypothetical protein
MSPQIFTNDFAIDLHVQSTTAPGVGESAALAAPSDLAVAVTGNNLGGPYRRIIQPAKVLVTRSRILRQTAEAAIEHAAKSGGAGSGTCCGCFCCPGKNPNPNSGNSSVASLAFESSKKHNSLTGSSVSLSHSQGDMGAIAASPAASP